MLTKGDLKSALKEFRKEIREEIEAEGKITRNSFQGELTSSQMDILERFDGVDDRLKDVEIASGRVEKELKHAQEDVKTVDLKLEAFNDKIDRVYKDMKDGFERVIDTIDALDKERSKEIKKIKQHIGFPQQ